MTRVCWQGKYPNRLVQNCMLFYPCQIPSREVDKGEDKFWTEWNPDTKQFFLQFHFKQEESFNPPRWTFTFWTLSTPYLCDSHKISDCGNLTVLSRQQWGMSTACIPIIFYISIIAQLKTQDWWGQIYCCFNFMSVDWPLCHPSLASQTRDLERDEVW